MSDATLFQQLYSMDLSSETKQKGKLNYLSWVFVLKEMKKVDPDASYVVHDFPYIVGDQVIEGVQVPYLETKAGVLVKVSVTIKGKTETEWLPVMDHKNQTLKNPSVTDINKTHKRCLAKAAAHHGLGLHIFAGEDLPEDITPPKVASPEDIKKLNDLIASYAKLRSVTPEQVRSVSQINWNGSSDLNERRYKEIYDMVDKWIENVRKEAKPDGTK